MSSRCHARHQIIYSTDRKVAYIQALLRVGFDSIDFGSFVSPKAIPQMVDTAAVLDQLDFTTTSKLWRLLPILEVLN
jgi:hydroxymethylglutaryl-CoA lyase